MESENEPILNKKKVLIILAVLAVAFGVASFALLYHGAGQDISDEQEPQLEFAEPGSKIAELGILLKSGGITKKQFEIIYKKLDSELAAAEPEAKYFYYVDDSLAFRSSGRSAELAVLDASTVSGNEPDEESDPKPDETRGHAEGEDEETELTDTLAFTMRSNLGTEYKIEVYTGSSLSTATVKIEQ